ncbi:MAG TPA: FAD binding domain-containing protein [Oscillatoriaceae cyanobacterium]
MKFHQPTTLADALALKAELGAEAYFLAGGTDLVVLRNRGRVRGQHWIDLSRIRELIGFDEERGTLRIGAATPHARLEKSPYKALAEAAASVGGPQIRQRGTVGGNVGNASPAGDVSTALLAHNAEIELASVRGDRRLNLDEFFVGPGKTVIAPDEIITAFHLQTDIRSAWFKVGKREATAISVVAAAVGVDARDRAYIALASVAPRPVRIKAAEDLVAQRGLSAATAEEAGRLVSESITPITDHRASAEYRRAIAGTMVTRMLTQLAQGDA